MKKLMSHPHIQSCRKSLSRNFHLCRNFLELLEEDWSNRECVFGSQPHSSDCRNSSYSNLTMHWRLTKIVEKNPCKLIYLVHDSSHARKSKTVLDSGLHAVRSGFQVLDSSLCQWNLDSGFQSLVGFQIPNSRISDSTSKFSRMPDYTSKNVPDSGTRIPLRGATRFKTVQRFSISDIFSLFGIWGNIYKSSRASKTLRFTLSVCGQAEFAASSYIWKKSVSSCNQLKNRRLWHFHIKTFLISGFQTL